VTLAALLVAAISPAASAAPGGHALSSPLTGAAPAPALGGDALSAGLTSAAPAAGVSAFAQAWGDGGFGQLGDGSTENSDVPVTVRNLGEVTNTAAGMASSVALLGSGATMAWGDNFEGRLGDGNTGGPETCGETPCSKTPVAVQGLGEVTAVAGGGEFSLALLANGTVMAWGSNQFGQLGDGSTESSDVPVQVSNLSEVTAIAAGLHHGLALLKNGTVEVWGDNSDGELGDGTFTGPEQCGETPCSKTPLVVPGLSTVTAVAGGGEFSLALLSSGSIMSFGNGEFGELGDASTENSDAPVPVRNITEASGVAAGDGFALALLKSGGVMSWGNNTYGELGDGGTGFSDVPISVSNITEASAIAAGADDGVALLKSGSVMDWGGNQFGQLGNGTTVESSNVPVKVSNLSQVSAIAAGGFYNLAAGALSIPTVTKVEPASGPAAGGTSVTITGTNLTGATAVKFGQSNAQSFKVETEKIIAVSPPGAGTVDVTVTTPSGTSPTTAADRFGYGPTVSKLEPSTGAVTGGETVTVTGTGFAGARAVKFGQTNAKSFAVESETKLTAVTPPGSGTVDVTVTTANGTSPTTTADDFKYIAPWEHPQLYVGAEKKRGGVQVGEFGWGTLTLSNRHLPPLTCVNLLFGDVVNETEPGGNFERAYGEILEWTATAFGNTSGGELGAKCKSTSGLEAWVTVEPPLEKQYERVTLAEGPEAGSERLAIRQVRRRPPTVPWRQEAYGEQNANSERHFFLRTGIATTERTQVEAEERVAGVPTERRTGCYRFPAVTEIVRAPGLGSARETEPALRPVPRGCISVTVVAPQAALEVPFQGTLEPEIVDGAKSGLDPSRGEFKGGSIGAETEIPSERSLERNERYLMSVFGPAYTTSALPIKEIGFAGEELIALH
jgi:alpha-tubulin suppressor-like RCC1 family protein